MSLPVESVSQYSLFITLPISITIGTNGPYRFTLQRIDGTNVAIPSSVVCTVIDPDGDSTTPEVTVESNSVSPVCYLDVQYETELAGLYRMSILITMPDTSVVGIDSSFNCFSF